MRLKFMIVFLMAFLLSGCGIAQAEINTKFEVSSYSEQTVDLKGADSLDISCDCSNIEVYTWKLDDIKFEITRRISGAYKKEILEEKLEDFKIDIKNENSSIVFKSCYNGGLKKSLEKSVDLKIYMPKVIDSMNYKVNAGNIKLFDDIDGVLNAELGDTDLEINKFDGTLNVTGNAGNVKVSNGKIKGNSKIEKNNGNISIKAQFDENGEYIFKTGCGNIDLYAKANSNVNFETVGELTSNEFKDGGFSGRNASIGASRNDKLANVRLNCDIGKIAIRKY